MPTILCILFVFCGLHLCLHLYALTNERIIDHVCVYGQTFFINLFVCMKPIHIPHQYGAFLVGLHFMYSIRLRVSTSLCQGIRYNKSIFTIHKLCCFSYTQTLVKETQNQ